MCGNYSDIPVRLYTKFGFGVLLLSWATVVVMQYEPRKNLLLLYSRNTSLEKNDVKLGPYTRLKRVDNFKYLAGNINCKKRYVERGRTIRINPASRAYFP